MTDRQITSLAREYAEEKANAEREQGFPVSFIRDMAEHNEKEMKSAIGFLLRRYYLVEKSKVENIREGILVQLNPKNFGYSAYNQGRKELLESLFPDLGKEVEE